MQAKAPVMVCSKYNYIYLGLLQAERADFIGQKIQNSRVEIRCPMGPQLAHKLVVEQIGRRHTVRKPKLKRGSYCILGAWRLLSNPRRLDLHSNLLEFEVI